MIENGKVPQSQLYDVKAQLADDELVATEARNSLRLSFLDLMQLMELKGEEYFDVDSLDESIVSMESVTPEDLRLGIKLYASDKASSLFFAE